METKLAHFLIIIMIIAALYVAVQSIIWIVMYCFTTSTIVYTSAVMFLLICFVGYIAKKVW